MKNILLFLCILSFQQEILSQTVNQITTANISFTFVEKDVEGSISGFSSKSKINWESPEKSIIKGSVATETLKTGNFLRDWSLKSDKYFNADEYPSITFESTKVVTTSNGLIVHGKLTIKSTTKPIEINFTKKGNTLSGTTTLFSSDFGITVLKKGRDSNKVTVNFDFTLK